MTTSIGLSAKQIIMYYQERPEIEEDYNIYQVFKNTEKGIKFGQKTIQKRLCQPNYDKGNY